MKLSQNIRKYTYLPMSASFLPVITPLINQYDWILFYDEASPQEILSSNLAISEKIALLPICNEENLTHLLSKVGLARVFKEHNIPTPPFSIAKNRGEVATQMTEVGFPLLLKLDTSSGGFGIRELTKEEDLYSIPDEFFSQKILIQKKIEGDTFDVSALFLEGTLIHFNCAREDKKCDSPFGISYLRTYHSLPYIDPLFFEELTKIGEKLGLHGFTNITCIVNQNKEHYYIEVDTRPNVWLNYTRFVGDDISSKIRLWDQTKKGLTFPVPKTARHIEMLVIPYFLRLSRWELLFNTYDVWKYLPLHEWKLLCQLLIHHQLRINIKALIKKCLPKILYEMLKKLKGALSNRKSPLKNQNVQ